MSIEHNTLNGSFCKSTVSEHSCHSSSIFIIIETHKTTLIKTRAIMVERLKLSEPSAGAEGEFETRAAFFSVMRNIGLKRVYRLLDIHSIRNNRSSIA